MGSHHFFSVEHYQPKSEVSSGRVYYPNLLYACMDCNRAKGAKQFPDGIHPEENPYGRHLKFEHTGLVRNVSAEGVFLIQQLNLNEALRVDYRRKHYELLEEGLRRLDDPRATRQLRDFFGFPLDMPIFLPNAGAVRPYSERTDLPDWY